MKGRDGDEVGGCLGKVKERRSRSVSGLRYLFCLGSLGRSHRAAVTDRSGQVQHL